MRKKRSNTTSEVVKTFFVVSIFALQNKNQIRKNWIGVKRLYIQ
jgi:hypothetical protein